MDDFEIVVEPTPQPGPGQVLVQSLFLSVDPYMRGRMNDVKSYVPPYKIGEVMGGGVVGRVVASETEELREGAIVEGLLGWQQFALAKPSWLRKVDKDLAPVSTALGVLGMPGLTAYFGLLDLCQPTGGECVVVSAASGAVGGVVVQIARKHECRVVEVVGSDEKARYIRDELGCDTAINYRTEDDLQSALAAACPDGIDIYFDNVGGPVTDAVIDNLAQRARIALCGQISQYNNASTQMGPRNLWRLLVTRSRMEGFIVSDFASRFPEALKELASWISSGDLKYRQDIVVGIENTPQAFIGMLEGKNFGKLLVQTVPDEQLP